MLITGSPGRLAETILATESRLRRLSCQTTRPPDGERGIGLDRRKGKPLRGRPMADPCPALRAMPSKTVRSRRGTRPNRRTNSKSLSHSLTTKSSCEGRGRSQFHPRRSSQRRTCCGAKPRSPHLWGRCPLAILAHPSICKTSSTSTGRPSGRLATPRTTRPESFSGPNTLSSSADAPSATFGWSRKSPSVAM